MIGTCGDATATVTYLQAWEYWASGRPDNECLVLWGLSLRWWGRIGQMVAFTGSFLLVAELVDLAGFADSLRRAGRSTFDRAAGAVWEHKKLVIFGCAPILFFIGELAFYLVYGTDIYGNEPPDQPTLLTDTWQGLLTIPLSLVVGVVLLVLLLFFIGYVIPVFIIEPLTWVLQILPRWAKVLNLLLIAIGFHFSLLAS